jgi:hypothetical protein
MLGEHGFVGLGLFCCLSIAIYHSCRTVQKRVRLHTDLVWAANLTRATEISLVAFVVGGSFVTIASSPFLFMLAGITVGTRSLVERELAATLRSRPRPSRIPAPVRTIAQPQSEFEEGSRKAKAWDLWLNCLSYRQIGEEMNVDHKTVAEWCGEKSNKFENPPPGATHDKRQGVVQHFDVWSFSNGGDGSSYFGRMPPPIVENVLWLYTEPGDIIVDPFAGGGTTIDVAKAMGRRV